MDGSGKNKTISMSAQDVGMTTPRALGVEMIPQASAIKLSILQES